MDGVGSKNDPAVKEFKTGSDVDVFLGAARPYKDYLIARYLFRENAVRVAGSKMYGRTCRGPDGKDWTFLVLQDLGGAAWDMRSVVPYCDELPRAMEVLTKLGLSIRYDGAAQAWFIETTRNVDGVKGTTAELGEMIVNLALQIMDREGLLGEEKEVMAKSMVGSGA